MGRLRKSIDAEVMKVTVSLDSKTFNALSLLAFLRKKSMSEVISDIVASKKNAINKEIDEKLGQFRSQQDSGDSATGEE